MTRIILICTLLIISYFRTKANSTDSTLNIKFEDYVSPMFNKDYNSAKNILLKRTQKTSASNQVDIYDSYNLACCYAHLKDNDSAKYYLSLCVKNNWYDPYIIGDVTFYDLQKTPWFDTLRANTYKNFISKNPTISNPELAFKLLTYYGEDQSLIMLDQTQYLIAHNKHIQFIDSLFSINIPLNANSIGTEAINTIPVFIAHNINNNKFENLYKKAINLAKLGYLDWPNVCILEDKLRINKGKKQLYGTQFYYDKSSKKSVPFPIKNKRNLEKRRAEKGFTISFEDYLRFQNSY